MLTEKFDHVSEGQMVELALLFLVPIDVEFGDFSQSLFVLLE